MDFRLGGEQPELRDAVVRFCRDMGFTRERPPHHLLERAWVPEHVFGNTDAHACSVISSIEETRA